MRGWISASLAALLLCCAAQAAAPPPASASEPDAWCKQHVNDSQISVSTVRYTYEDEVFEGVLAYSTDFTGPRPVVMIAHDWDGRTEYELWRAKYLAAEGYIGFAIDLFGLATPSGDNLPMASRIALMAATFANATRTIGILNAALDVANGHNLTNGRNAVLGYCFGGAVALDMARLDLVEGAGAFHTSNVNATGVVPSFGNLTAPGHVNTSARVAVWAGIEDSIPLKDYVAFMEDAENGTVVYDVTLYSDTVHAFTEPTLPLLQHDQDARVAYSPYADARSWASALDFLAAVFREGPAASPAAEAPSAPAGGVAVAIGSVSDPYAQPSGNATAELAYTDAADGRPCVSRVAYDAAVAGPRPVVLVLPDWTGIDEYETWRAQRLAQLGYFAVVVDVYTADVPQPVDNQTTRVELSSYYMADASRMRGRIAAALAAVKALPGSDPALAAHVDADQVAAIGYCFGGSAIIDLARAPNNFLPELRGAVAFHAATFDPIGGAARLAPGACPTRRALVLQGYRDASYNTSEVAAWQEEMSAAGSRWEYVFYGRDVPHAYTIPTNPDRFRPIADERSWAEMTNFLSLLFAGDIGNTTTCLTEPGPPPDSIVTPLDCHLQPPACEDAWCEEMVEADAIVGGYVEYVYEGVPFRGYAAHPKNDTGLLNAVVVLPDWDGLDVMEVYRSRVLASEGYLALAVPTFAQVNPAGEDLPVEARMALTGENRANATLFHGRLQAGVDLLAAPPLNASYSGKFAAFGYCYGGSAALEMARQAANASSAHNFTGLRGSATFHGGNPSRTFLDGPALAALPAAAQPTYNDSFVSHPRVAVFSGLNDTSVTQAEYDAFIAEAVAAGIDWELTLYSHTRHAFTLPYIPSDYHTGGNAQYSPYADGRSWANAMDWLEDVFDPEGIDVLPRDPSVWAFGLDSPYLTAKQLEYPCGNQTCKSFATWATNSTGDAFNASAPRPVVAIVPDWDGVGQYEMWRAKLLAQQGYIAVVVDVYSQQVRQPVEDMAVRITQSRFYLEDAQRVRGRMEAAVNAALADPALGALADSRKVGVIGYCFGGTSVIDFFYRDAPGGLRGVVSLHPGTLAKLNTTSTEPAPEPVPLDAECPARLSVQYGSLDPAVTNVTLAAFEADMEALGVYFEVTQYGRTQHAWTVAPDNENTTRYNPTSDWRSWASTLDFLKRIFACDDGTTWGA